MKIKKINEVQVSCSLSENELKAMDIYIKKLKEYDPKTSAFMNALVDVILERTNLFHLKENMMLGFWFNETSKQMMVLLDGTFSQSLPEGLLEETEELEELEESEESEELEEEDDLTEQEELEEESEAFDFDYLSYKNQLEQFADNSEYEGIAYMKFASIDEAGSILNSVTRIVPCESIFLKRPNDYVLIVTVEPSLNQSYQEWSLPFADFIKVQGLTALRKQYMEEHYEPLIKKDAIQILKTL